MASSDKPDFIEIDQKDAPVRLTEGGIGGEDAAGDQQSSATADDTGGTARSASTQAAQSNLAHSPSENPVPDRRSKSALSPRKNDDTVALMKRNTPTGKPMRKVPGGMFAFVGLLAVVCLFGNSIDEMRNRTLADLAKGFAIQNNGYVETVGDLGASLSRHNNLAGAKGAYEKALVDLAANNQDNGPRGAFIRLKLAKIAFANANEQSRISHDDEFSREDMDKARTASAKFKAEADGLAKKALEMLKSDHAHVPSEMPFLLFSVADDFDDWFEYGTAIKLNEQALDVWGKGSPNRRSNINAALGFEYLMQKNWQVAEDYLRQSVTWSMRDGANSYNSWRLALLGRAQIGLKKYTEAEVNLSNALKMRETTKKNRDTKLEIARIYTDLGRIKAAHGNNAQALEFFEKSEKLLKKYPERTWDTMRNQMEMANLYRDMGQFSKAENLYTDVISKLNDGEYGPDRKDLLKELSLLRSLQGGH